MPDIQAQAADGTTHVFPDGTKPEVIDRVMKQYAMAGAQKPASVPLPNIPNPAAAAVQYTPERKFEMNVAKGFGLDPDAIAKAEAAKGAGPNAGLGNVAGQALSGLAQYGSSVLQDPFNAINPIHGMASNLEQGIQQGNPGQILGAGASILGGAEGVEKFPPAIRDTAARALRDQSGKLRTGVKVGSKLAGAYIGHSTGLPEAGIAGYLTGPAIAEAIAPARDAATVRAAKIAEMTEKAKMRAEVKAAAQPQAETPKAPVPTPAAGEPNDLISRTQRLVKPGEMPSEADIKRAGDLTQAPLAKLKALAKFGDKLAQNELNRRLKQ